MYKFVSIVIFLFLYGCDNAVLNNSGAVPNIEFTGSVWAGNVRNAKVLFVGVDRYGQPQRQSDGSFYGDAYYTDELGQYSAAILGSYAGSLIAIASYAEAGEIITSATTTESAVKTTTATEIKCVLPDGCLNETGDAVSYGDWYPASDDFELWGALGSVVGLETFNITPVTHLAASLAFNQRISDGVACDKDDCITTIFENSVFTPESIYQANHRVKQFFLLDTGLHINTQPWFEGISASNATEEMQYAKHGLMAMALQSISKQASAPLTTHKAMDALEWWVDSFLNRDGNLYVNHATSDDLGVKSLFETISEIHDEYEAKGKSSNGLDLAAQAFAAQLQTLTDGAAVEAVMPFTDVEFSDSTADKITAAQALVSKVKSWFSGFENNQYESFFDADVANKIKTAEDNWASYNKSLSPVMRNLFKPIVKVAEYALTCTTDLSCDSGHDLNGVAGVVFDAASQQVSFTATTPGAVLLDDENLSYESINIVGSFNSSLGQSDSKKIFEITEASLVVAGGAVNLLPVGGVNPQIIFYLNTQKDNQPYQIDIAIPELVVASDSDYQLKAREFLAVMLGTLDVVETNSEYHYNLETIDFSGQLSKTVGNGDAFDLRFTLNSENAQTYYSPNRFPDLEINIDSTLFKNYTKFEGDASAFISNQGGWFTPPDNAENSMDDTVSFYDLGEYKDWGSEYETLKDLLNISNTTSAKLGSLTYPGGETALVIYKVNSTDSVETARQCNKVGSEWGCQAALPVSSLGCGSEYSQDSATIISAFSWLKKESCISQVKIDGRGIYDIDYGDLNTSFVSGHVFSVTLSEPEYLGIKNLYVDLISNTSESNEDLPVARVVLTGSMPDSENVALGLSVTHNYTGGTLGTSIGIDNLIPYGENSIWLAVAHSSAEQDALVYYIQDGNITMTFFGFDYADIDGDTSHNNPSHSEPLAVIRYDGQLLGTLRSEGDLYVIRYIDGSWQLL